MARASLGNSPGPPWADAAIALPSGNAIPPARSGPEVRRLLSYRHSRMVRGSTAGKTRGGHPNFALLEKHLENDERRQQLLAIEGRLKEHDYPPQVVLENTSICNLTCIHCSHRELERVRRHMKRPLWNKIVEELGANAPFTRDMAHLLRRGPDHGLQGRALGPPRLRRTRSAAATWCLILTARCSTAGTTSIKS